jgi:glycosyltransferase involved in cell wall biosynthesis
VPGPQPDLRPFYDAARVFIVPTRYAAGIPFKAHEAAAFGVPLVVSGVIARPEKLAGSVRCLVESIEADRKKTQSDSGCSDLN